MALAEEKKVVLITGATGGLGQGLVEAFKRESWNVAAAYRSGVGQGNPGQPVYPVRLDVEKSESIVQAVKDVLGQWGRVDALINNAGITKDSLCSQMSEQDWDAVLSVNLRGAFLCSQAVIPPMLKRRNGHIINISSWSGRAGSRGQANYAAAKAGLLGLTTSLALELGSRNIRVNAILPGLLPTRMTSGLTPEQMKAFAGANALQRINSVEEVARFVVFLTSLEHVSGQIFQLDSRIGPWS